MKSPLDIVRAAMEASRANLAAARANLDAAEASQALGMEMLAALEPEDGGGPCRHENRQEMGTLNNPDRWRCLDCGHYHDGSAESGTTT
jgi:hypothetical protein